MIGKVGFGRQFFLVLRKERNGAIGTLPLESVLREDRQVFSSVDSTKFKTRPNWASGDLKQHKFPNDHLRQISEATGPLLI